METENPDELVHLIREEERRLLAFCKGQIQSHRDVYHTQLFGLAVARRSLGLSAGFRTMVEQSNSTCAMPIVRMQLDTALRLYAGFFVDDPYAFSKQILDDIRIDKMKADDGQRMTDKYLADRVGKINKWVPEVYRQTSGFIHLSRRHLTEMFRPNDDIDSAANFTIAIGSYDSDRKLSDFREPLSCFLHLSRMIAVTLEDWFEQYGQAGTKA